MTEVLQLPLSFAESEKGNTMLVHDDGAFVIWIPLEGEKHAFEIADTPGNSPRFEIHVIEYDPVKLRQHVMTELEGWNVERWNLDGEYPGERIPWEA